MNFAALKTELGERGFSYLSDTRQGQYINWARGELDDMFLWPYLLTSLSDVGSPHAITDFRSLRAVFQTEGSAVIPIATQDWLRERYGDLSTTGTAAYAYMDGSAAATLRTYPHQTEGIDALYYKTGPDLTGTDTPLAPTRFHDIIVDLAVERAYRDSDNHEAAGALRTATERRIAVMVKALMMDGSTDHVRTGMGHW